MRRIKEVCEKDIFFVRVEFARGRKVELGKFDALYEYQRRMKYQDFEPSNTRNKDSWGVPRAYREEMVPEFAITQMAIFNKDRTKFVLVADTSRVFEVKDFSTSMFGNKPRLKKSKSFKLTRYRHHSMDGEEVYWAYMYKKSFKEDSLCRHYLLDLKNKNKECVSYQLLEMMCKMPNRVALEELERWAKNEKAIKQQVREESQALFEKE